jgi:hypothetical protein
MTKEKNSYFFNYCLFGLLFFSVFSALHCGTVLCFFFFFFSSLFFFSRGSHQAPAVSLIPPGTCTLKEPLNSWLSLDVSPISTVFRLSINLGLNSLKLALTFFDHFLDFLIVY